jgi:hypothetical protein
VHIRQIALVARELEPVVADLCAVFELEVAFRDPGVGAFGLANAVMPVGDRFLEVVSPERDGTTAGRFLERRGGDAGYMVILQTGDLAADRARLDGLGVRVVWQIELADIATVHLHPRDVGGAIVSLDQPKPPESWRWGGPEWTKARRSTVAGDFHSATLEADDPAAMARRWSDVLGRPLAPDTALPTLLLDGGAIRFVAAERPGVEGLVSVSVATLDAERALCTARQRGLETDEASLRIGGVWFELQ